MRVCAVHLWDTIARLRQICHHSFCLCPSTPAFTDFLVAGACVCARAGDAALYVSLCNCSGLFLSLLSKWVGFDIKS